jgi:RimJ/RimL family protein N-acetyltransferase
MIQLITEKHIEEYIQLRQEALLESPLAFASSPQDDFISISENLQAYLRQGPESVIFGAFTDVLVGSAGLYRDRHLKAAHKAHLWGMYICPAQRGQGLGRQLLQAAIDHARTLPGVRYIHLSVSAQAIAARQLYDSMGFTIWGTEPDALLYDKRSVSEHHMVLPL